MNDDGESLAEKYFILDSQEIVLTDFEAEGYTLDIGGGGEGIIGRLKGDRVIAIDVSDDELKEAPEGPLKIVMDARDLKFQDKSFNTVTAFFSLMYFKQKVDVEKVFQEVHRILCSGGVFYLWDVEIPERPDTDKEIFLVHLHIPVGGDIVETAYGQRWPDGPRGIGYYETLANEAGLKSTHLDRIGSLFHLQLVKE